jgi:hypothetical protein
MRVAEHLEEGFHVGKLLDILEKLNQEDAYRVICKADQAVAMGEDGADKGKIDQGSDHAGQSPTDVAIGPDGDVAPLVAVMGQQKAIGLRKGTAMGGVDGNSNAVEFLDDASEAERSEILPHATPSRSCGQGIFLR